MPAFVFLLAARASTWAHRAKPAFLPAPSMPMFLQFTRTLDAHVPAIYPHPRFFTRNLPHPWHPPPVTTQPPAKPFARAYPRPTRPVSPLVHRARGTRRPSLPSHPRKTFACAYPTPAHPDMHPESPLPYPRPCVARPRGARDPCRPLCRAFSSPQCPPPVATQPGMAPFRGRISGKGAHSGVEPNVTIL